MPCLKLDQDPIFFFFFFKKLTSNLVSDVVDDRVAISGAAGAKAKETERKSYFLCSFSQHASGRCNDTYE